MIHRMVAISTPLQWGRLWLPAQMSGTPFGVTETPEWAVWSLLSPGNDSDGRRQTLGGGLRTRFRSDDRKGSSMSFGDKIKHAGEEAVGKVKEATGKVTGNESLEAEGQADQAKADVKQAGDKAGDAAKDVFGN